MEIGLTKNSGADFGSLFIECKLIVDAFEVSRDKEHVKAAMINKAIITA